MVEPELVELELTEPELVEPELTEPEPVVHTQKFIANAHPRQIRRYELPAENPSKSTLAKAVAPDAECFEEECLKNQYPSEHWQSERFGRVRYGNQANPPKSILLKNNHVKLPAQNATRFNSDLRDSKQIYSQQSDSLRPDSLRPDSLRPSENSRVDFPVGRASTSDYSYESTLPDDFEISPESLRNESYFDPNPQPSAQPNRESTSNPDLAGNSNMVRKVNWEQIVPDSQLATLEAQPVTFPELVRQISPPETELRAFAATKQGKTLATRGAYFAAKEEFMNALMIVAQSNDKTFGNRGYTTSLLAGFKALKESEDFATTPQRSEHSRNLQLVLASHKTKVIPPDQIDLLSFNQASEAYCQFAQARIEQAIGESKAASSALFHLSRILSTAPELRGETGVLGDNSKRAILLASLTANPANFEAANELGVLFFDEAWYKPAVHWFSQAVKTSGGRKLFWQNLAEAHKRLASTTQLANERAENIKLAQLAYQEASTAPQLEKSSVSLAGWVTQEQFQKNSAIPAPSFNRQAPVSTAPVQTVQPPVNQRRKLPRIKDWFQ